MLAFVPALGPILGAVIAMNFGWRAIFVMLGIFGLFAFCHALMLHPLEHSVQIVSTTPGWAL